MSDPTGSVPRKLAVFAVPPPADDGERRFWPRIGVAFTNRDGSINLILDALPLGTNKLQIREEKPAAERGAHPLGPPGAHGGERRFETVEVGS